TLPRVPAIVFSVHLSANSTPTAEARCARLPRQQIARSPFGKSKSMLSFCHDRNRASAPDDCPGSGQQPCACIVRQRYGLDPAKRPKKKKTPGGSAQPV